MTAAVCEARASCKEACKEACRVACKAACGERLCPRIAGWARKLRATERARRELDAFNEVELRDIGLSRCAIGAAVSAENYR
jgi:uncharacterized protein YjiS (DUF1127 family)